MTTARKKPPATFWSHRVVRTTHPTGEVTYGIHEVYFRDHGATVEGWTARAIEPHGETLAELRADYDRMAQAFDHPVIDGDAAPAGFER